MSITPVSYDMLNGEGGFFRYWDLNYTGSGSTNTSLAPLSGGLGDLTDGIIATDNWFNVENLAGTGPYVAWQEINPTITFNFDKLVNIDSVTIWVDDANGFGSVATPSSAEISMGGIAQNFNIVDPVDSAPIEVTFSDLNLSGTSLDLTLFEGDQTWIFLSEVAFEGSPVSTPEPSILLGLGTLALAGGTLLKRKQKA